MDTKRSQMYCYRVCIANLQISKIIAAAILFKVVGGVGRMFVEQFVFGFAGIVLAVAATHPNLGWATILLAWLMFSLLFVLSGLFLTPEPNQNARRRKSPFG